MRYDDPRGSPKGLRPGGIPAVAMEIQTAEQIEEESIGGDSEVEVLEPLEGHNCFSFHSKRSRNAFLILPCLSVSLCSAYSLVSVNLTKNVHINLTFIIQVSYN